MKRLKVVSNKKHHLKYPIPHGGEQCMCGKRIKGATVEEVVNNFHRHARFSLFWTNILPR